eukprot:m.445004 g.445004  ORF g.445004 m.445004 type:complete len:357 (-) comp19175_c0_seq1:235-1305(-)
MIQDESQPRESRKRVFSSDDDDNEEKIDWQMDKTQKPPHSYAMLIYLTIKRHGGGKITLAQVYTYILENFAYYRHADPGWKNSIRHNLTQHKCFLKVPRAVGEPGKGGFWALDPAYIDVFESGTFKGTGRRVPNRKRLNPPSGIQRAKKTASTPSERSAPPEPKPPAEPVRKAAEVLSPDVLAQEILGEDFGLVEVRVPEDDGSVAVGGIGICTDPYMPRKDVLKSRGNTTPNTAAAVKRRRIDPPLSELMLPQEQPENVFDYSFLEELCGAGPPLFPTDCTTALDGFVAWPSEDLLAPSALLDRFRSEMQQDRYGVLDQRHLFDYSLDLSDDFMLPPISTPMCNSRATSPLITPV